MPQIWDSLMGQGMPQQQMPAVHPYWQGLMQAGMVLPNQMPQVTQPLQMPSPQLRITPEMRDAIERQPSFNSGYDRNAIQGDDLMRQYFMSRGINQENI
jgi:hypothetical protein